MCGICGTIGIENPIFAKKMRDAMSHRGPDDCGLYQDKEVCLGHTRLSIIDLSSQGHQPMSNEDETIWVVFNGEIYNFKELRKDLEKKGHYFKSKTDTEVILHLYEEDREDCLKYLRGMFAFAIWDKNKKRLFAARDRFGIKPFFYHFKNNNFVFSSELKTMLAPGFIDRYINMKAVRDYFTYGSVQGPHTMIKDIFQLLPAHYIIFENNKLNIRKYWDLNSQKVSYSNTEEEHLSEIKQILSDAVKLRMISDVPLGVFLSGGIDSSSIAALTQKHSPMPVKTFSIIFEEAEFDERRFSRKVAEILGTEHTEVFARENEILDEIPKIFDSMDQPSIDGFNTFIISQAVRGKGLKVALSGLGGDEIFAGYPSFRTLPRFNALLGLVRSLPEGSRKRLFRGNSKISYGLSRCKDIEDLYLLKRTVFLPNTTRELLKMSNEKFTYNALKYEIPSSDPVNQISFLELMHYLQNTLLQDTDRMSMANSLEVRVPFLDHLLVEKMFQVPGRLKLGRDFPKRLLVKLIQDMLPEEIYNRPKKGFVLPFEHWLKNRLKHYCENSFSEQKLKNIPFLNPQKVNEIWMEFLNGSGPHNYSSILSLLSFINWYERNI